MKNPRIFAGHVLLIFLKTCTRIFKNIEIKTEVIILVSPEHELDGKSKPLGFGELFYSNSEAEWQNGLWAKIRCLANDFLFTCSNLTLIFTVFSSFWCNLFLNGFPNPFIVQSNSSFLFSHWKCLQFCVSTCPAMVLQFKKFELSWWAVFFLRYVHAFSGFFTSVRCQVREVILVALK